MTRSGQSIIPIHEEDELPGAEGDGPELTVVEEEQRDQDRGERWPGLDDEKEWASLVEQERDFQVKQVTLVEVMENRGASAVLEAVGRMAAKLNFLGLLSSGSIQTGLASIRARSSTGGSETEVCAAPLLMATTSRATAGRRGQWHSSNEVQERSSWLQALMRAIGVTPLDIGLTPDSEVNWSRWGGSVDSWRPLGRWSGPKGSSTVIARSTCRQPGHR